MSFEAIVVEMNGIVDGLNENPINWVLLIGIAYLVWVLLAPTPQVDFPIPESEPEPVLNILPLRDPQRDFTMEDLKQYNGETPIDEHNGRKAIYLACNGVVFDVTSGRDFYGPGGPYAAFAGRNASRGLATMSLAPPSDEWDDVADLGDVERDVMLEWASKFSSKYPVRGRLVRSHDVAEGNVDAKTAGNADGMRKRGAGPKD